jgi:phosphatidylserine/phosphatidylglycerophosphate/cardiolipin synthase-like enzyme
MQKKGVGVRYLCPTLITALLFALFWFGATLEKSNGANILQSDSQTTSTFTQQFKKVDYNDNGTIRLLEDREYFSVVLQLIQQAEEKIDVAMFLFKTSSITGNRPTIILNELIKARQQGKQVRVFLERSAYDDNINRYHKKVANKLKNHGIMVIYDSPSITTHSKLIIIDSRFVVMGSHNLTHAALSRNHETSLFIDDPYLAQKILLYIDRVFTF